MKYSIIIPAYNEQARIAAVLEPYLKYFSQAHPGDYEIIVVCNGCGDKTPDVVRELQAQNPGLSLIEYKQRLGKGGAIIQGFKKARGMYVGFIDADESVAPRQLDKLFSILSISDNDGVISSRHKKQAHILVQQSPARRIASRIFNLLIRLLFKLPYQDTQCGAKVFKKTAITKLGERER